MQTLPTEDIDVNAIYLVPIQDPQTSDNYAEYIYLNGVWEKLGETPIEIDLTDYVKNTDYAGVSTGGVIKIGSYYATSKDANGFLTAVENTYNGYLDKVNNSFISKGTLENVITGKGLVSNTDYATSSTGGVIKINSPQGTGIYSSGVMYALTRDYATYSNDSNSLFVGKGTLENVITGKGLVSNTNYANANTGGVIKTNSSSYSATTTDSGALASVARTYQEYGNMQNNAFISKGTLENVITGKGLSLPIGTELDIPSNATLPTGWEQIEYDTGWVTVPLDTTKCSVYTGSGSNINTDYTPKIRRIGNIVYLRGKIKIQKSNITTGSANPLVTSAFDNKFLTDSCEINIVTVLNTSGKSLYNVYIGSKVRTDTNAGKMCFYGTASTWSSVPDEIQIQLDTSWALDDTPPKRIRKIV